MATLRLSDWTGSVVARFGEEDLSDADRVRGRLYRLWGDLLQNRSRRQVKELLAEAEGVGA